MGGQLHTILCSSLAELHPPPGGGGGHVGVQLIQWGRHNLYKLDTPPHLDSAGDGSVETFSGSTPIRRCVCLPLGCAACSAFGTGRFTRLACKSMTRWNVFTTNPGACVRVQREGEGGGVRLQVLDLLFAMTRVGEEERKRGEKERGTKRFPLNPPSGSCLNCIGSGQP